MTTEDMQFFGSLFRSLEREVSGRFDRMEARFERTEARLDRMDVRLQRMDNTVTNGTRQMVRMIEWSEKQDQFQSDTLRRISELNDRIKKLEGNGDAH